MFIKNNINTHLLMKIIIIGLFSVALIGVINILSAPEDFDPSNIKVLPIRKYYSEAESEALVWDSDAYLVYINASFAKKNKNNILLISYVFRSRTNPGKWLLVSCADTNPVTIDISEGEFNEGHARPLPKEIDIATLQFDSFEAIAIAFENGGIDFANKNQGVSSDSFVKIDQENMHLGTGQLEWNVILVSGQSGLDTMFVTLDAMSGKVIGIKRTDE